VIRGSETDIDRVRDAIDLVQLIGEHVALQPKGREHVGLCPFHEDRRPSMTVVTHKGNAFYKCHACGASGDTFTFVMEYHRLDFGAALRFLAERAGITLEGRMSQEPHDGSSRSQLKAANGFAATFFQQTLKDPVAGAAARAVIEKRRIAPDVATTFGLGAAPDAWDGLTRRLSAKPSALTTAVEAGLLRTREDGGHYDWFRNRLIFPIADETGSIVAFGGRSIDPADDPKYLNSPDTPVFNKSRTLYGLSQAKRAIVRTKRAIVTEGYTDVIACHQAGFDNAVSTLGTALTKEHGRVLSRLCDTVVLVFDGDEAGQKAADRGVEIFFAEPVDIRICVLPDGLDPDELLSAPDGAQRFQDALDSANEALAYKLDRFAGHLEQTQGLSARQKLLEGFLAELGQLGIGNLSGVRRRLIMAQLAQMLGVGIEHVDRALPRNVRTATRSTDQPSVETATDSAQLYVDEPQAIAPRACRLAERDLLAVLIYEPSLRAQSVLIDKETSLPLTEAIDAEMFRDEAARRIATVVFDWFNDDRAFSVQQLLAELTEPTVQQLATKLYFEGQRSCGNDEQTAIEALQNAVAAMTAHAEKRKYQERSAEYRHNTDHESALEAAKELLELRRRQGAIASAIPVGVRSSS
jgi:DNA primase